MHITVCFFIWELFWIYISFHLIRMCYFLLPCQMKHTEVWLKHVWTMKTFCYLKILFDSLTRLTLKEVAAMNSSAGKIRTSDSRLLSVALKDRLIFFIFIFFQLRSVGSWQRLATTATPRTRPRMSRTQEFLLKKGNQQFSVRLLVALWIINN